MPITSPRPLVAPSTRRRPVPDAKVGSMVRSPQGLWRRRREDEHHRRVVRGDDRNVPDATRWGERATFEPMSGPRARSSTPKSEACAGGEDLKTDPRSVLSTPILLEVRRAHCPHSQAHECRGICPLFITLAAPAHAQARAHVHVHVHVHVHMHLYVYMYMHMYVYAYVYMYMYMCV